MSRFLAISLALLLLASAAAAEPKPHVITFGKWTTVKWYTGTDEKTTADLKIRALFVDGRVREFALGAAHEVTDRLFVVRRAFRMNDALPEDAVPRWRWQRGGWLLVDRLSGRISPIALPEFDAYYSAVNWYRDFAAYCGVSDDGKKVYAVVAQLGRHKPILREALHAGIANDDPDSACPAPHWQSQPARVSFAPEGEPPGTFAIHGHAADVVTEEDKQAAQ